MRALPGAGDGAGEWPISGGVRAGGRRALRRAAAREPRHRRLRDRREPLSGPGRGDSPERADGRAAPTALSSRVPRALHSVRPESEREFLHVRAVARGLAVLRTTRAIEADRVAYAAGVSGSGWRNDGCRPQA